MTLQELREYVFTTTNQYFLGIDNFEIDENVLKMLVEKALSMISEKRRVTVVINVDIEEVTTEFKTITDEFGVKRYVKNIQGVYMQDYRKFPLAMKSSLELPNTFWNFDTRRRILFTQIKGKYYIEFICRMELEDIDFSNEYLLKKFIEGLSYEYLGHARTDFGMSDLPFNIVDLRDKGSEIIQSVVDELNESGNYDWYSWT